MFARKLTLFLYVIVVIAATAGFIVWRQTQVPEPPRTAAAERRDVVQEIAVTGKVEPETSSELGFEYSGTVTQVAVSVGDTVAAGQALINIDSATASFEGQQAVAAKATAQEQAKVAWENSQDALANTKAENARKLEEARQTVRDAKKEMDNQLKVWQRTVDEDGDQPASSQAVYQIFLTKQTAYKAAQKNLETLLKTAAKTNDASAATAAEAEAAYRATVQAGPRTAGISSVQAAAEIANIKLSKTTIRAPFSGVVTAVEPAVGEVVTAGSSVITVATPADLKVVADAAETDAAKLTGLLAASITFDALPADHTAAAMLEKIDPAARVLEGVPTYRLTFSLAEQDSRLRPGMTANITVHAAKQSHVIAVPQRAVAFRNSQHVVQVYAADGTVRDQSVTVGLVGSDGFIEITSGVSEGDLVVLTLPADSE